MSNIEIANDEKIIDHKKWQHFSDAQIEQIRRLAALGYSAVYIGRKFNSSGGSMRETMKRHGIKLIVDGRRPLATKFGYGESAGIYRTEAAARGMTVGELAMNLLETISRDNLFAAVLDDDAGHA